MVEKSDRSSDTANSLYSWFIENFLSDVFIDSEKKKDVQGIMSKLSIPICISDFSKNYAKLIESFLTSRLPYSIFNFMEGMYDFFHSSHDPHMLTPYEINLGKTFNGILDDHDMPYQFCIDSSYPFNGTIRPRLTTSERNQVNEAKTMSNTVKIHLEKAELFITNHGSPDFKNSVKESVTAIESFVSLVLKDNKITLGNGLKKLGETYPKINNLILGSISKLYGFASDSGGIRHGKSSEAPIDQNEAVLFLIVSSAFVNYLNKEILTDGIK